MLVWADGDTTMNCPDEDGQFDAAVDLLVHDYRAVIRPTTASATARFFEKNNDSCTAEGGGPEGPITLSGTPAAGPCCVAGQTMTLVVADPVFSGAGPVFDYLFRLRMPMTVTSCEAWPGKASCKLDDPNGCLGTGIEPQTIPAKYPLYDPNWKFRGPAVVVGNLFYVPAKVLLAVSGPITTAATYAVTLGDADAAGRVWSASTGGDYLITPGMVDGSQAIHFLGPGG
jgi:hypothetical protein